MFVSPHIIDAVFAARIAAWESLTMTRRERVRKAEEGGKRGRNLNCELWLLNGLKCSGFDSSWQKCDLEKGIFFFFFCKVERRCVWILYAFLVLCKCPLKKKEHWNSLNIYWNYKLMMWAIQKNKKKRKTGLLKKNDIGPFQALQKYSIPESFIHTYYSDMSNLLKIIFPNSRGAEKIPTQLLQTCLSCKTRLQTRRGTYQRVQWAWRCSADTHTRAHTTPVNRQNVINTIINNFYPPAETAGEWRHKGRREKRK